MSRVALTLLLLVATASPVLAQARHHVTFTGEHVRLARELDHPGRPTLAGPNADFAVELDVAFTCATPCTVELAEGHHRFVVIPDDGSLDSIEPSSGLDILYDTAFEIRRVSHDEELLIGLVSLSACWIVAIFGALLAYSIDDTDGTPALAWLGSFTAAGLVVGLPFLGLRNYWEMVPAS